MPTIMRAVPRPDTRTKVGIARGYLTDAEAFLIAAKTLERSRSKTISFAFGPKYYLACHAIELILKSYILVSGGSKRALFNIRHDLVGLLNRSTELGLKPKDKRTKHFVNVLGHYHLDHRFRYRKTGLVFVVDAKAMCKVTGNLINQIGPIVNAAMHAEIAARRA